MTHLSKPCSHLGSGPFSFFQIQKVFPECLGCKLSPCHFWELTRAWKTCWWNPEWQWSRMTSLSAIRTWPVFSRFHNLGTGLFSSTLQDKTMIAELGESQPRAQSYLQLLGDMSINVTSFSSIPYCSNSEYWTQKRTQSESIHSIILDVHVLKAEHQNSPFLSIQLKLDKKS